LYTVTSFTSIPSIPGLSFFFISNRYNVSIGNVPGNKESILTNQRSMGNTGSSSNPFIPLTVQMQELERLQFSQNLRKNPAEYSAYVNQRIDSMTGEISQTKDNAFRKAQIDLSRYMDMDHNANFYRVRNNDVDRLTQSIEESNAQVLQGVNQDKQNSKRQFEINEWYNNDKLETLFFLQLFFVASLVMIIIVSVQKRGFIAGPMAAALSGLIAVGVAGVGIYRYMYTEQARDPRLWNRRRFGAMGPPPPNKVPDCPVDDAEEDEDDDAGIDGIAAGIGACSGKYATKFANSASSAKASLKELGSSLNKEMINFVSTGKTDIDLQGELQGALNQVCPGDF